MRVRFGGGCGGTARSLPIHASPFKHHRKSDSRIAEVWPNPLYRHSPDEYFADDCVTEYLRPRLVVALIADSDRAPGPSAIRALNATLQSLHQSLDLRACSRFLVTCPDHRVPWQREVEAAVDDGHGAFTGLQVVAPARMDGNALLSHARGLSASLVLVCLPRLVTSYRPFPSACRRPHCPSDQRTTGAGTAKQQFCLHPQSESPSPPNSTRTPMLRATVNYPSLVCRTCLP